MNINGKKSMKRIYVKNVRYLIKGRVREVSMGQIYIRVCVYTYIYKTTIET